MLATSRTPRAHTHSRDPANRTKRNPRSWASCRPALCRFRATHTRHDHVKALYHSYQFVFGKKIGVIKFHPSFSRLLVESNDVKDVIHGRMLPMLVPPRPWLTYNSGGYLTVDRTTRTR